MSHQRVLGAEPESSGRAANALASEPSPAQSSWVSKQFLEAAEASDLWT